MCNKTILKRANELSYNIYMFFEQYKAIDYNNKGANYNDKDNRD